MAFKLGAKRGRQIAAALSFLAILSFNAFCADTNRPPKSIPELQTAIEAVLKKYKVPGASIAIVSRDKVDWVAGLGKADVAANKPATADTLFRIGSVSKGFAALSALKLQEQGKLKLTDTVHQWVPDVAFTNPWEATDPVRLVHLMEHTTGFDDIHPREYALDGPTPINLKTALAFGASSRVCRWRPGTRMAYCNSGPAVLAAVVEKVSGQRFEDYVRDNFFHPLHMDTASYFRTLDVEHNLTRLYHRDGVTPYPYWNIAFRPSGAINASARDMASYVRFYLQRGSVDGTNLLQPSSIERMESNVTLPSAKLGNYASYGLYNYSSLEGAFIFHGHDGAVLGGVTTMCYLPEYGRGCAIMINAASQKALAEITRLVQQYLIRGLARPALPPTAKIPHSIASHYEGYYQAISPRVQRYYPLERLIRIRNLDFSAKGLSTTIYSSHPENWVPVSDRLYRRPAQSEASLALLPDADGETLIQIGWVTYKKVSPFRIWGQISGIILIVLLMGSSVAFVPLWIFLKFTGKFPNTGPLSVRALPLLSTLLHAAMVIFAFFSHPDVVMMGAPSWFSLGILFLTAAFPLTAFASLFNVWRRRFVVMDGFVYWHSVLVSAAVMTAAVYMGYWGLICLRLWT